MSTQDEARGIVLVGLCGLGCTFITLMSTLAAQLELPFWPCLLCIYALLTVGISAHTVYSGEFAALKSCRMDWPWILLRGFASCGYYFLAIISVAKQVPIGDANSLVSTNVMVSALAGWLVLGERLRLIQVASLAFTVVGVVLVCKPEAIFHTAASGRTAPLEGYLLALASGACSGFGYICSRKAPKVGSSVMTLSTNVFAILLVIPMIWNGIVADVAFHALDFRVLAWLLLLLLLEGGALVASNAGAQLLPAAVSSTVFTSVNIASGYIVQIFVHERIPDSVTMLGVSCMSAAVLLMVVRRKAPVGSIPTRSEAIKPGLTQRLLAEDFPSISSCSTACSRADSEPLLLIV